MTKPSRAAIAIITTLLLFPWAVSCGDFFPSTTAITSISVSPSSPTIKQGTTQQFTAMAVLGNNQTKDVTTQVSWTSSATDVATIDAASGLATASATTADDSTTTIQAQSGDVKGTTVLTVSSVIVDHIAVSAPGGLAVVTAGGTLSLTATATMSDNSQRDVTSLATWSSSDNTVATVVQSGTQGGVVTGVISGRSANITASFGGQQASLSVLVQ